MRVDQTLHGYSDGHRLIYGSFKLQQSDARTMLMLSDASGSGSRIPSEGYLTGYPLAESGKYVLARTWAALEMSRPGCVWTHSLLIDFADLARLGSALDLLECFQRPSGGGGSDYSAQLEVAMKRAPTVVPPHELRRAGQWASALYGKPKGRIIAEREGPGDDALVLAIWMQQWPRLRRAFRFCSFSADDRSTSADTFDLQLMDAGRSTRSRRPDVIVATAVEQGDWLGALLDDLELPARSHLRQFLRDVGSDVTNGRAAMVPLIHLHGALEPNAGPSRLADAVSELERLGSGQGRMGRAAAARVVLSRSGIDDSRLLDFALQQVRADRDLLGIEPAIIGQAILRWRPELLADGLAEEGPLQKAVEAALPGADLDELVGVLEVVPGAASAVLPSRPDLLEHASFWRITNIDALGLIRSLDIDQDHATRIVSALAEAARDDCSRMVVDCFGISPVVVALSKLDIVGIRSRMGWVRTIARRTNDLAERMADGGLSHRPLLFVLAEILDPDAVPNSVGTDPWVAAVERTKTTDDVSAEDLLAAFLFNRARGLRSGSTGRLFLLSVQRLHEAMASERLSGEAWRIAKQRLPYGSVWRDWDQCEKLRHAVVDDFIDRDLPPIEFGTVVDDGNLWKGLVDLAAESTRGRRYLDKVRGALRGGHEGWWVERAKLIDRKVK
ncbi:GAP1-N1 domain-containing protein [Mesorhizobium sp. ORM8.1]